MTSALRDSRVRDMGDSGRVQQALSLDCHSSPPPNKLAGHSPPPNAELTGVRRHGKLGRGSSDTVVCPRAPAATRMTLTLDRPAAISSSQLVVLFYRDAPKAKYQRHQC